jgi:hypothetical protein
MATTIVPLLYLKVALGITGSAEDAALEALEAKAAAWVEEQTGKRRFRVPAATVEYVEGKGTQRLILEGHAHGDQAVAVTERFMSGGTAKAFTAFERRGDVLVRTDGQPWHYGAEYAVSFQDGYPDGEAPGDIQQLVVDLVQKMREVATGADGLLGETIGDYSYSVEPEGTVAGSLGDGSLRTLNRWRRIRV